MKQNEQHIEKLNKQIHCKRFDFTEIYCEYLFLQFIFLCSS